MTFLRESTKLARQIDRKHAKLEIKADPKNASAASAAMPPVTPQKARPRGDPLAEIQRIEQEIAEAKTFSQMKRAQSELARWRRALAAEDKTPSKQTRIAKGRVRVINGKNHDADILHRAEAEMAKGDGQ